MHTPTFHPVNQQCVSPDPRAPKVQAPSSQLNHTRVPPTGQRGWIQHRPKSPRVVVPAQKCRDLSHRDKRRRRGSPHTPHWRREQPPREAKPLPSIEESVQKGPFDPYAFLGHPPSPSLPSPSTDTYTSPSNCSSDMSTQDGKMTRQQEQRFGHRNSIPFRCSPRKQGSSAPFGGWKATENARPNLSLEPTKAAGNDDSHEIKREESIAMTPVIRHTSVAASLQNTQARERKLKENGVVELDRDEFALQRFLTVQGEMTDLEAILMKGKKRHVFEQIKRNAATKSLRGVEKILAENDATPTPTGRQNPLQEGTTGKNSVNEHHSEVVSKVVDMSTATSQRGPTSTQDAPSNTIFSKDKTDASQKDRQPEHGAVHPSRRHVFDHSEVSKPHEKSRPALPPKVPKRKELPGLGLIFNPRPNPPPEARKHEHKKLPRDLQRREVDIHEVKESMEKSNDEDVENAIDSAQDWLQSENALDQEARAKRWKADPNWKHLTADQIDTMRRQSSIPPSRFYGHRPKWRTPPGWRQRSTIEGPTFTSAEADDILARVKGDQASRLLQRTKDADPELASFKLPLSNNGKKATERQSEKKIQTSTRDDSNHSPKTGAKINGMPKAKSTSREEKEVRNAVGHEDDSQPSTRDGKPAVKPRVKPAKDMVETSKTKSSTKKRKRDTDVPETPTSTSTMKVVSESPYLPSMKTMIEGSQLAINSSPAKKKKSKKSSDAEAVEDVVDDAREPKGQMVVTTCPAQSKKSKGSSCTEAVEEVVNDARDPSTPSRSKKRKKVKETKEVHEAAEEEMPTKTKKRKRSGHTQESDETVVEKAPPETLIERLRRIVKKKEKALAPPEASKEPSQPPKKLDQAPPTAPVPAVEDVWQPIVDDEDPISPPQPLPASKKKHKSKRRHQADTPAASAVDDTTPETTESPPPASPPTSPTRPTFNHLRRRHQSLPLRLNPTTTTPETVPPQPQPPPPPNLYDLNLLAIRTRLSNLEAAIAANPAPPPPLNPTPNALTPLAALKLRLPPLPRAVPPGTTRLSDAELIRIGKRIHRYERHTGAPYAFSWRGRLYAEYDYLMDWVDERGRVGWDFKEKARLKHS